MLVFIKRLFEPVFQNKLVSAKLFTESALGALWFDIFPLFTIPFFINLINERDFANFETYAYYLLGILTVAWVTHLFVRKWDFQAKAVYLSWIEKNYREKIILKDNLSMDMLGTGKVQSILGKGMNVWIDTVWNVIYQIPKLLFTFLSGFIILKNFGYGFILFFILFMVVSGYGFYYFRRIRLKYDEKVNKIEDEKSADSVRVIMSRAEVVFSGKEKEEVKRLASYSDRFWDIWKVSLKFDFLSDWFISGLSTILPIVGILVLIKSGKIETLDSAFLVSFIYFASRFAFNMYSMLWMLRITLDNYPKINNLYKFFDEVPQIKNYEVGKKFSHGNGEIIFKNVSFNYDTNKKFTFEIEDDMKDLGENENKNNEEIFRDKIILENFNLTIAGGTKIALVGKSGSGKTTIAKLASGYISPSAGEVLVDGQDLQTVSLKSFYKYVGYLTQEPLIFDGSIKENLLYALSTEDKNKIKKDDDLLLQSLRKANCDFVFKMKNGINTQIGERGVRLSGGERQRLAIAKLFLKNPEIIILDEPTSALDSFSEVLITKSLEELFIGRTVIIIAHRLQTVKKADKIFVIENGKVIEEGSHDDLVRMGGRYTEMLNLQSGF